MTFIENPQNDPVLRRGDLLIRYGGMTPLLSLCVYFIVVGTIETAVEESVTPLWIYYTWLGSFSVLGQAATWLGMYHTGRARAWNSGIQTYIWSGALTTTLTVLAIVVGVPVLLPLLAIPWAAPIVSSTAKRRLVRGSRATPQKAPRAEQDKSTVNGDTNTATKYILDTDGDERDHSTWVPVPTSWPAYGPGLEFADIKEWANYAANAIWDDSAYEPDSNGQDTLAETLAYMAEHIPQSYPGFDLLLHLKDPRELPLPVFIGDFDSSDMDDEEAATELRLWTIEDPHVVEPPVVEDFASPHLGNGLRVLRYSSDPDTPESEVIAGLRYGWHVPGVGRHAYLITASLDSGDVLTAIKDIDALARCIRYVEA